MYIPVYNQLESREHLLDAMRRYPFATLFGPSRDRLAPLATHLPLLVSDEGPWGTLEGHFALANKHWRLLAGAQAMVVFHGPHAYVSPSYYVDQNTVPTWNYLAVHAYGQVQILESPEEKQPYLSRMIASTEPAIEQKWQQMTASYRRSLLAGIVVVRMTVDRVEGKAKLGQNRSTADRQSMHAHFKSGSETERDLAAWMERLDLL